METHAHEPYDLIECEPPRVLVVDDDLEFLTYVRDGLVGARAAIARTPLEALWLLERQSFRAVVCDLVFGDVDGRHLLEIVRERWPVTARILVTGFGSRVEGATASAFLPAAQAVIVKPCDVAALDELIADLPDL